MIIDNKGRIAYHAIRLREDGGSDFVQYHFDGKELYKKEYRKAPIYTGNIKS